MNVKTAKKTFGRLQIVLLIMLVFFAINFSQWNEKGFYTILLFVLIFEFLAILASITALFSKGEDHIRLMEDVVKESSVLPMVIILSLLSVLSFIVFGTIVPFPITLLLLILVVSWMYCIVAVFSQRVANFLLLNVIEYNKDSLFTQMNRFLIVILYYPVHIFFSSFTDLKWWIRKPLSLLLFIGFTFLMATAVMTFTQPR